MTHLNTLDDNICPYCAEAEVAAPDYITPHNSKICACGNHFWKPNNEVFCDDCIKEQPIRKGLVYMWPDKNMTGWDRVLTDDEIRHLTNDKYDRFKDIEDD